MTIKIEKLTPEQESQLSVYRESGIEIGLSTEPADRDRAEAGVRKAYELVGLNPPENFIWCGSPFEGAKKASELSNQDGEQVWYQVGNQVGNQVMDKVWNQVWDRANQWIYSIYGQHESYWLLYYKYFQEVCNIEGLELIEGLYEVACSAGWWWTFEDTVILTERPCELHLNGEGKLHNESGMAIKYPDDWGIYALNGEAVEKKDLPLKPLKRFYYLDCVV